MDYVWYSLGYEWVDPDQPTEKTKKQREEVLKQVKTTRLRLNPIRRPMIKAQRKPAKFKKFKLPPDQSSE